MDNRLMLRLQQILEKMNVPITVLDGDGNSLIPASDIRFTLPPLRKAGEAVYHEGRFFQVSCTQQNLVFMVTGPDLPQVRDTLSMCDAMVGAVAAASAVSNDINNAYQRILQNELSLAELEAVADEYNIRINSPRCVLLMHMVQVQKSSAFEILQDLLPMSGSDVLVSMDKHTAVYLKDATGLEEEEDLHQFSYALQETLMGEMALSVTIGISTVTKELSQLHTCYRQARRAIEIGRVYSPENTVHMYRTMYLQRFLADLNPDVAAHYYSLLFNPATNRLFSEEMLHTIEMFFKKDLNLSETARQLYIHRNTLVYRLDKVQRALGLDLRKFDDAVTFKMLFEMRKCGHNRAAGKKNN
ncbi:MAG: helix-turn-helix domain-containing protein [Clostridia bacterium]|nr:helix-turn-helix domain-containing protein [Clostridia bacterium]